MKASGSSFSFLTTNQFLQIPFFQRAYVWDEENWSELLENITGDSNTFLGSIIVKNINNSIGDKLVYSVVDGQQRLTTITILIKAISLILDNYSYDYEKFYFNKDFDGSKTIKIVHSRLDSFAYEKVINAVKFEKIEGDSRVIKCFNYFYKRLSNLKENDIFKILKNLTNEIKHSVVLITIDENDNEQAIFDTINNSGVKLTSADTIKNLIFQRAIETSNNNSKHVEEISKIYDKLWANQFHSDETKQSFWEKYRKSGRILRTNLEILLYSFALIKNIHNPNESNLDELHKNFKKHLSNLKYLEILELIKELNDYATSYYIIFDDYDNYNIDDHDFFKLLIINDKLESSSFYPYVLKLSMDKEKNRKNVNLLSEYLIKNSVVKRSNKNFNKECYSLIHGGEFQLDNILKTDEFSKANFKNGLRSIKSNKVGALLLSLVELERRKGLKTDFKTFNLDLSLEHIMPQSWSEKWSTERTPVVDENNKIVNDQEKARSIRNDMIYSIGNMTLLNKPLNSSLKNNDFATKVNGDGKKLMGYKDLSDLLITKIDIVNEVFVYGSKSWNENQIRIREDKIFKELYVKFYY